MKQFFKDVWTEFLYTSKSIWVFVRIWFGFAILCAILLSVVSKIFG